MRYPGRTADEQLLRKRWNFRAATVKERVLGFRQQKHLYYDRAGRF
jgi:hypothetical protein